MSGKAGRMFISGPGCNVSVPFAFGTEATDTDAPVADDVEPVAAEPWRVVAEPDGDDTDSVADHLTALKRQAARLRTVGANYAASLVEKKIKRTRELLGDDLDTVSHA